MIVESDQDAPLDAVGHVLRGQADPGFKNDALAASEERIWLTCARRNTPAHVHTCPATQSGAPMLGRPQHRNSLFLLDRRTVPNRLPLNASQRNHGNVRRAQVVCPHPNGDLVAENNNRPLALSGLRPHNGGPGESRSAALSPAHRNPAGVIDAIGDWMHGCDTEFGISNTFAYPALRRGLVGVLRTAVGPAGWTG